MSARSQLLSHFAAMATRGSTESLCVVMEADQSHVITFLRVDSAETPSGNPEARGMRVI